jgi:hypothetical protein
MRLISIIQRKSKYPIGIVPCKLISAPPHLLLPDVHRYAAYAALALQALKAAVRLKRRRLS